MVHDELCVQRRVCRVEEGGHDGLGGVVGESGGYWERRKRANVRVPGIVTGIHIHFSRSSMGIEESVSQEELQSTNLDVLLHGFVELRGNTERGG